MPLTIAALPLSGGELAICPMPGCGGSYDADLRDLLAWGPALVISMTALEEMEAAGAGHLPGDLAAHGILWRHLPIPDFGTPGVAVQAVWPAAASEARAVLEAGGRVVIHCMGGRGRSGMAALRLMVEAGESPHPALERLRKARPCAVETDAQFDWAARGGDGQGDVAPA